MNQYFNQIISFQKLPHTKRLQTKVLAAFLQLNNTKDVSSIAVMLLCHLGYAKEPVIMMRSAKDTQSRISMEECFVVLQLRRLNVLIIGKSFPVEAPL